MCNTHVGSVAKMVWKDGKLNVKAFNLPCNKWSCPVCAKRKAAVLGNRVKEAFKNEKIRFATFTDSGKGSLSQRLQNLKKAWNRLRGDLVRYHGLSMFFWVLEFGGKGGRPHLHALLNCYVDQRVLSKLAKRAGFGSIVDIRAVKNGGGFGYVFKYLSKDCGLHAGAGALRAIKGRRFGVSRNIKPIKNEPDAKQTCIFSKSCKNAEDLKTLALQVAKVAGKNVLICKKSASAVNVLVQNPHKEWVIGANAPIFPLMVPTFQHLQALAGTNTSSNSWLLSENSLEHLNTLGLSPSTGGTLLRDPAGLTLLHPTLYQAHVNASLHNGVIS